MEIAAKYFYAFVALVLLTAYAESSVSYDTYHNQRYGYIVAYPDFLLAQGEATSQDGQKFISADQGIELLVYRDYKNDYLGGGDLYTPQQAYQEALQSVEGVLNSNLEGSAYLIEYQEEGRMYTVFAELAGEQYLNIRFSYPLAEQEKLQEAIFAVIQSLTWEDPNAEFASDTVTGDLVDIFPVFLEGFLNDVYWGKNFNSLLQGEDPALTEYIDRAMDVRRYYAPGTVAKLALRKEGFAFAQEDDFANKPQAAGNLEFIFADADQNPCMLDFNGGSKVYYQQLAKLPDLVVNTQTFVTEPVAVAYPHGPLMAVYLPNAFDNPRGFYFIGTPTGWKLAFVDDTLCSA